jgi:hypothetical protein
MNSPTPDPMPNQAPSPLPFRTATTRHGAKSHLVLHSPRVQHLASDALNGTTLCCHTTVAASPQPIGDVECRICLFLAPRYMTWPVFGVPA